MAVALVSVPLIMSPCGTIMAGVCARGRDHTASKKNRGAGWKAQSCYFPLGVAS
jgi:hypothetical protein